MSSWTHIIAAMYVKTYIYSSDVEQCVKKMLEGAPKITGSEGDADVFVNVLSGHNHYTSSDCRRCEFGNTRVHLEEGGFTCDASEDYDCPEGYYQTCVVITVVGDLRDRCLKATSKEWDKFRAFIEKEINGKGFQIRECTYDIREW